jgi:hypothetical protein
MATVYRLHSQGPEVGQIQSRLQATGWYSGPIDNDFGGVTEAAVRGFQQSQGLAVDGEVGPATWASLFSASPAPPTPSLLSQPLAQRCLALTGTFETGAAAPACYSSIAGDFDNQWISFGALQWNLGQGTLQALLLQLDQSHPQTFSDVFGADAQMLRDILNSHDKQQAWALSIQSQGHQVSEPWHGRFVALGQTPEFQHIELRAASSYTAKGEALRATLGLVSQRAAALLFDVAVQNGGIRGADLDVIRSAFAASPDEADRLRIVAQRVADRANSRWKADVLQRKLTIANGQGTVHGRNYQLGEQYGITLDPA